MVQQAKPAVPAELPEPKAPAEAKRLRKEIQRLRAALEASNKEFEMAAADAKVRWCARVVLSVSGYAQGVAMPVAGCVCG